MSNKIDGWTLLARIAANPEVFSACDTTAALSSLLLLRSQLVQGVASRADLAALTSVVGHAAMIEVIDNLAGYEALRVIDNLGAAGELGANRGAVNARRWLLACLDDPQSQAYVVPAEPVRQPLEEAETFIAPAAASRALRRHRAMGARRLRSGS